MLAHHVDQGIGLPVIEANGRLATWTGLQMFGHDVDLALLKGSTMKRQQVLLGRASG